MKHGSAVHTDTKAFSSFSVDDLERARTFYGDVLGLNVEQRPEGLELEFGAGHTVFLYQKPNHQPATFTVLNFPVDNLDEAVDRLTQLGVRFEQYDMPQIRTNDRGIARGTGGPAMAWFKDPAGNILSVLEAREM
jgi:catechol 2,3-dioxygenase-like lactoylglutathione lyase family enzyme